MALFDIDFMRVEYSYHTETIEAESKEDAERIANQLVDSLGYCEWLVDMVEYDDGENSVSCVSESEEGATATLSAEEIADYIGEE